MIGTVCASCLAGELNAEVLGDSAADEGSQEACILDCFAAAGILNDSSYDAVGPLSSRETGEHARIEPMLASHRPYGLFNVRGAASSDNSRWAIRQATFTAFITTSSYAAYAVPHCVESPYPALQTTVATQEQDVKFDLAKNRLVTL